MFGENQKWTKIFSQSTNLTNIQINNAQAPETRNNLI
jgi:hypothetical protein